jgi:ABC-2 type transport system ATP-binding protein
MIKIKNLTYDYPEHRALKGLYTEIKPGTITAVVGPNGAGKSTLFKCITTLLKPAKGTVFINGRDVVTHPRECKKVLGYLPDTFGLYDALTVSQVFSYFAQSHGLKDGELHQRVTEMIAQMQLTDKAHELCGSLSRGMRQRVAIGQAMIHKPALLVLDEPQLKDQGVTLLISSHILAELDQYADDLLILRNGELVNQNDGEVADEGNENQETERILLIKVLSEPQKVVELLTTNTYVPQSHDGAVLSILSRVTGVSQEKQLIKATLKGTEKEQSQLLKFLIENGCTISECTLERQNLQETYLSMVKEYDNE